MKFFSVIAECCLSSPTQQIQFHQFVIQVRQDWPLGGFSYSTKLKERSNLSGDLQSCQSRNHIQGSQISHNIS